MGDCGHGDMTDLWVATGCQPRPTPLSATFAVTLALHVKRPSGVGGKDSAVERNDCHVEADNA